MLLLPEQAIFDIDEQSDIVLADVDTADGSIEVIADGQITADDVNSSATDDGTNGITLESNNDDIIVNQVIAGSQNDVNLEALQGEIDGGINDQITADVLTATARDGIGESDDLDTNINSLDASVTGTGNIRIDEQNDIVLTDVDTADGSIEVIADGQITADDVNSSATDDGTNGITLESNNDDIIVNQVIAGSQNDVNLEALQGEIDGGINDQITADVLTATARDGIGASDDLDTEVNSLDATVTGTGDIDIDEQSDIELTDVDTANGNIEVTANGQITAKDVVAAGAGSDVDLTTDAGSGADVVVDLVQATDTINITSDGAIREDGADAAADLVASVLNLVAKTGIFGNSPIETSATTINAQTLAGGIEIENDNAADTTVDLDADNGNVEFTQKGGGDLIVTLANADNGDVSVVSQDGADIILGLVTALGTATVNAAGDMLDTDLINEPLHVIADVINLLAGGSVGQPVLNGDIDIDGNTINANVGGDFFVQDPNGALFNTVIVGGTGTIQTSASTIFNNLTFGGDFSYLGNNGDLTLQGTTQSTGGSVNLQIQNGSLYAVGAGPHVVANDDSIFATPNGTQGTTNPINVNINGGLFLDIGEAVPVTFSGDFVGTVNNPGAGDIPLFLNASFPSPLRPPGNVFFNGVRIWPSLSSFILSQAVGALSTKFLFPTADVLEISQINTLDVISSTLPGPVFLYHPIAGVDAEAFNDEFRLEEEFFQFIEGILEEEEEGTK
jgi:hypothetical protein